MKSLLQEPLFQFLALGGALFVIFALFKPPETKPPLPKIEITPERIDQIRKFYTIDFKKPPTTQELEDKINDYVREEILFREAKQQGLDLEDTQVRNRLRIRMEGLNADLASIASPTDAELEAFLKDHPAMFQRGDQLPTLEEARPRVTSAWVAAKRKEASDAAYEKLRKQYLIQIDQAATTQPATTQP